MQRFESTIITLLFMDGKFLNQLVDEQKKHVTILSME